MPKVSVIVNCFNGEKYLEQALDSIYGQTYKDWEIIFWDNLSTDQTPVIAQSYKDGRLKYFRGSSFLTLGAARYEAVKHASGEWVAFLDSDDIWRPEKLEIQFSDLENSQYILCYAGISEINAIGEHIRNVYPMHKSGYVLEQALNQFEINMVTAMVKREALNKFELSFDKAITASEEYNLFVRLAAKGLTLVQPKILGAYRVHKGSLTDRQIGQWAFERRYTLAQLKEENPDIQFRFPKAFEEAYARGSYYEARHLMSKGCIKEARNIMVTIANIDFRYALLYFSLYFPMLWDILHSNTIKRVMLARISSLFNKN